MPGDGDFFVGRFIRDAHPRATGRAWNTPAWNWRGNANGFPQPVHHGLVGPVRRIGEADIEAVAVAAFMRNVLHDFGPLVTGAAEQFALTGPQEVEAMVWIIEVLDDGEPDFHA